MLGRFGQTYHRAVRTYREFMAEGLPPGRRPELTGGVITRGSGGRKKAKELDGASEGRHGDERVLGGARFVAEVHIFPPLLIVAIKISLGQYLFRFSIIPER